MSTTEKTAAHALENLPALGQEQQQRSEATLLPQAKILQSILDSMGDGVVVADERGKFLLFNPTAERIVGIGATEVSPAEWPETYGVFYPDTITPFPAQELPLVRAIQGEASDDVEMFIRNPRVPDGVAISVTGRPLKDADGFLCGGVVVFRDISERKRAAEALRDQTRILQSILDSVREGVIVADQNGQLLLFNRAAEQLHGAGRRDLTPDQWSEEYGLYLPDMVTPYPVRELPLARAMRGEEVNEAEVFVRHAQGTKKDAWVSVNARPLQTEQGAARGGVIVLRDISERKRAEDALRDSEQRHRNLAEKLQDANEALEAFAYTVSHDLRAPLRAMQGFAQVLLEDHADRLEQAGQDYARRIVSAAQRMGTLIQDLLAYSRLSRADLPLGPVGLQAVMTEVLAQLHTEVREREAQVTVEAPLPVVEGHYATLVQVVANLLTNAVKFVAPEVLPRVRVWTEERAERVRLWVEDNGIGIAPEYQERIFHIFERLHGMDIFPGTGIGLAIVRKGVERMGGRVGVESVAGQGSRFWVELPKAEKDR